MKQNMDEPEISSLAFYTESHRLIKFYLQTHLFSTSAEALQYFVNLQTESGCSNGNSSSIEEKTIEVTPENIQNEKQIAQRKIGKYQKTMFLEEIRVTILSLIPTTPQGSRERLQRYHLFIHLIELLVDSEKTKYQKVNEFLNANFVLDSDDLIGHAVRGNFGALVNIDPKLGPALEEINMLRERGFDKKAIAQIKTKYGISDNLVKIITGIFRDFRNSLEMDCYYLQHGISVECESDILKTFDGDFSILEAQVPGFVNLIFHLIFPATDLGLYERCFEQLFFETFKRDYLIALDFLAFSRKCEFYFPSLVEIIPLNCISVESLIRFASRNGLDKESVIIRFAYLLQEQKEYDQLCRFVLNNKVHGLKYTKGFLKYLLENHDRFRFFISDEMASDKAFWVVSNMARIEYVEESVVLEMFESEYFIWFVDEIMDSLEKREDISESATLGLINMLLAKEKETGISLKGYKNILTKKLLG